MKSQNPLAPVAPLSPLSPFPRPRPRPCPQVEALDLTGRAYWRPARCIDELPLMQRPAALGMATAHIADLLGLLALRTIPFGAPVSMAFMTPTQAKMAQTQNHPRATLLRTLGCDLSLDLCPAYESEIRA